MAAHVHLSLVNHDESPLPWPMMLPKLAPRPAERHLGPARECPMSGADGPGVIGRPARAPHGGRRGRARHGNRGELWGSAQPALPCLGGWHSTRHPGAGAHGNAVGVRSRCAVRTVFVRDTLKAGGRARIWVRTLGAARGKPVPVPACARPGPANSFDSFLRASDARPEARCSAVIQAAKAARDCANDAQGREIS
jgi:hypothetical protein